MTNDARSALEYLDSIGVKYTLASHEKVSTIAECALVEQLLGGRVPRNLFLTTTNRSKHFLLLSHPDSVFRTSSVSRQAQSSRLSFAKDADLTYLLHTRAGAVSPLGLIYDSDKRVGLLIDKRLLSEAEWVFHPLDNTMSVKIMCDDFLNIYLKSLGREALFVDMND